MQIKKISHLLTNSNARKLWLWRRKTQKDARIISDNQLSEIQSRIFNEADAFYGKAHIKNYSKSLHSVGLSFFDDIIIEAKKLHPKINYLEIGSNQGISMCVISSLLKYHECFGSAISIDPYFKGGYEEYSPMSGVRSHKNTDPSIMQNALDLYKNLDIKVTHMRDNSFDGLKKLIKEGKNFHLIYIDGYHDELVPTIDFGLAYNILDDKGIIILDDWMVPDIFPIKKLCDQHLTKVQENPDIAAYFKGMEFERTIG